MLLFFKKGYRKIKKIFLYTTENLEYDFNTSNPLGGNGERVDIQLNKGIAFDAMDIYQKNHWKRYEFAKGILSNGEVCGDFACGTGYGSIFISDKVAKVIGADINSRVIEEISIRYNDYKNIKFLNENLLSLSFKGYFNTIISFETLEHFKELDIKKLMIIFNQALKHDGKLIFSTPYMQEQSEEAIKMGFHLTFYIDEAKIKKWLVKSGFEIVSIKYQNYDTHLIENELKKKDFIICVATKVADA